MAKRSVNLVQHLAKHQETDRYGANRLSKSELMPNIFPNTTCPRTPVTSLFAIMMVSIGAFAGGLVNGLAGFGTGLFALGWWLAAMPVNDAVSLVIIMSIFSGVQGLFIVRFSLNAPDLGRFLVPALLGIGVGFAVLDWVNVLFLKMIVATLLVLFGLYFTIWRHIPKLRRRHFGRYLNRVRRGRSGGGRRAVWRPANNVVRPA